MFIVLLLIGNLPCYAASLDTSLGELTNQIVTSMSENQYTRIAVIEFSDLKGNITELGKFIAEELTTRLFLTKKFEVVERELLNKVLKEHKLNLSGLVDPASAKELGKILGVSAIVSGTITDLGKTVKINSRLIATESGTIFAVAAVELVKDEGITNLLSQILSGPKTDSLTSVPTAIPTPVPTPVIMPTKTLPPYNNTVETDTPPRRDATKVTDVFEPYTADEWIVSPDEEPAGDQEVDNAPECDIKGVIACYDKDYLRVDILLKNSITFKWDLCYRIKVEYDTLVEYFTYYTASKKFVYDKERDGKIVTTKTLTKDNSKDSAGVTNSGDGKNDDIYFIMNKNDHIGGKKGERYYLTTYFSACYIDKKGKLNVADETIPVKVEFER